MFNLTGLLSHSKPRALFFFSVCAVECVYQFLHIGEAGVTQIIWALVFCFVFCKEHSGEVMLFCSKCVSVYCSLISFFRERGGSKRTPLHGSSDERRFKKAAARSSSFFLMLFLFGVCELGCDF